MAEKRLHGGRQIARVLKEEGVEYQFGISGAHVFPIMAGAGEVGIEMVHCRHEQTAAYAADGYARASGKVGVCFATAGPGVTNEISAIAQAHCCRSPVVILCGQHVFPEDGRGGMQEFYGDQVMQSFTKWTRRVLDPHLIACITKKAFIDARTPPRGPVAIEFPLNVLMEKTLASEQWGFVENSFQKPGARLADPADVEKAVRTILEAERPVVVGGECIHWAEASEELREFAELMRSPVVTRRLGRGGVPEDHAMAFSGRTRGRILRQADRAVLIGLRLDHLEGYGAWARNARLIQVNETEAETETAVQSDVVLIGNAKSVLRQMIDCAKNLMKEPPERQAWLEAVGDIKRKEAERLADEAEKVKTNKPIHPGAVAHEVLQVLDDSATIILDAFTGSAYMTERIRGKFAGCVLDSGSWAGVGHGVGMAIGAQLARPGKQVVAIMGDGGMGLGGFDVETAVRCKLPVVYLIHNNDAWMASTSDMFRKLMPVVGIPMVNPFGILPTRYDKVFEPLGCYTDRVEDPAELRAALEKAFNSGRTAVIDVVVDPTTPHPSPPKAMAASLGWMDPQDLPEQLRAFIPAEVQKGKE